MGTGYTRNDASNNIADGNVINASDLDGEFDAVESAFGTSGHTHDGTAAEGGAITKVGPVQDIVVSATNVNPKTNNAIDLGTASLKYKDAHFQGSIDTDGVITAATFEPDGDTAAGDNAAIGYTAAEGLILTGQGSTNDVTIKNDADADVLEIPTGTTNVTVVGDITSGGTLNVTGDTAAGDAAAIGYTAAEGLILTGQGSTSDITLKNDADAVVFTVPTGTDDILFPDNAKAMFGAGSDLQIYHDGSDNYVDAAGVGHLYLQSQGNDKDVKILSDDGSGGLTEYFRADGSIGKAQMFYYGTKKLETTSTGVDITGGFTATDGSTITVDDNSDNLTLTSTDADASAGPNLNLYRNSASPADGDFLGNIKFNGRNDNSQDVQYAEIEVYAMDVSDGAEDGLYNLNVMTSGTNRSYMQVRGELGEIVFNESSADVDFRVESDGIANMLFVDGALDQVAIGTSDLNNDGVRSLLTIGGSNHAIHLGSASADGSDGGGFFTSAQKDDKSTGWTTLGFWDNGSNRQVYYGGGNWGPQEATMHIFYTGSYDAGSGGASERFRISDTGVGITGGFTATDGSTITTADNSIQLELVSTDADANSGAVLSLYRNSASPADGDDVGQIEFNAENSADEKILYADLLSELSDVSDGTEDGRLALRTVTAGTMRRRLQITETELVINESSIDSDFRVESDNETHALFVQGSDGLVGIGQDTPTQALDVAGGGRFVRTTNLSNVILETTDTDANEGPVLDFYRNPGQAGADSDLIGRMEFNGLNDASEKTQFATIFSTITDASDGSEDGSLRIKTMLAGTARDRITINETETVINDGSQDLDFRVESDNDAHAFFVEGSTGNIAMSTSDPDSHTPQTHNPDKRSFVLHAALGSQVVMSRSDTVVVSGDYIGGYLFKTNDNSTNKFGGMIATADDATGNGNLEFFPVNSTYDSSTTAEGSMQLDDADDLYIRAGGIKVGRSHGNVYTSTEEAITISHTGDGSNDTSTQIVARDGTGGNQVFRHTRRGTVKSEIEENGDFLSATNSYGSTSDGRLKENIAPASSQWNDIKALQFKNYSMIDAKLDAPNMLGVIAQDLQAAGMNGLVKQNFKTNADDEPVLDADGNQEEYLSVKYSVLYMKAVKALQEAMAKIEVLETKVAALEG